MAPIKTGPSPQQPEMKSQESSINLHLGLIAYKCLTMFFLFETSTSNISENPKVDMERNPLLHQKFYVQPRGMCHFWFSPLPHGKTWAFCTPEILGFQNLHFGVFSLGYISTIPQRIDWIFFCWWEINLGWWFGLDVFSCFVLGIMRNMVFFHVLLCICGSFMAYLFDFGVVFLTFFSWVGPLPSHPGAPGVLPVDMVFIDPPFHLPRAPRHATLQCLSAQRNLDGTKV